MNSLDAYTALGSVLRPFALPYAAMMAARRACYTQGLLSSFSPACPCVAVGNIAWGGSGKTPFVAWLLAWARARKLKAVVLTRGYGGNPGKSPLLVEAKTCEEHAGDEPLMLAQEFPEASVLSFPGRAESARYAEEHLRPDIFILDDGMQHLAVRRHVDIVLLRPEDLEKEWNRVIPSGSWREGVSALKAASVFAVRAGEEEFSRLTPLVERRLSAFRKSVFSFLPAPRGLRLLYPDQAHPALLPKEAQPLLPPHEYADRPYILMSGVGNPASVEENARILMGRPPLQHFAFADHHPYTAADVQAVVKLSAAPLPVLCTAKDAVKLKAFGEDWGHTPVWVMETELEFGPALFSERGFPQWWENWWDTRNTGAEATFQR